METMKAAFGTLPIILVLFIASVSFSSPYVTLNQKFHRLKSRVFVRKYLNYDRLMLEQEKRREFAKSIFSILL